MNDIKKMYDVILFNVHMSVTITSYTFLLTITVVLAIKTADL